jgi:hypothetical protein
MLPEATCTDIFKFRVDGAALDRRRHVGGQEGFRRLKASWHVSQCTLLALHIKKRVTEI